MCAHEIFENLIDVYLERYGMATMVRKNSCKTSAANVLDNNVLLTVDVILTPEILQAPESTVVFLDQSAVFTCETVGGALSWIVNGTQREVLPDEIRRDLVTSEETVNDGGRTEQSLTIPARAEYNGTRVQCLVLSLSGSDQSESATMIIQGITLHVVDLVIGEQERANLKSIRVHLAAGSKVVKIFTHLRVIIGIT